MKGYCPICKKIIDEVEYCENEGKCYECLNEISVNTEEELKNNMKMRIEVN